MNIKKLITGIVMVAISYFVVFVPSTFEFLEDLISIQSIQGIGFVFIGVGIVGFLTILNGLN